MAERPLLILPTAEAIRPPPLPYGGDKPIMPARGTQANRIAPSLRRLKAALNRGPERVLELRADPTALAPDRVIVFEIAGTVADFARAAARVPGLELMVEYETESAPDEFFAKKDTRKGREGQRREDKLVDGRFYLAMPDVAALDEFIRPVGPLGCRAGARRGPRAVQAPVRLTAYCPAMGATGPHSR